MSAASLGQRGRSWSATCRQTWRALASSACRKAWRNAAATTLCWPLPTCANAERIQCTIRTQSTVGLRRTLALRRRAVQRDDVADLQAAFVNDDALDHELQDRLPVGERGSVKPAAHPFAERGQVGHDLVRLGAPVA